MFSESDFLLMKDRTARFLEEGHFNLDRGMLSIVKKISNSDLITTTDCCEGHPEIKGKNKVYISFACRNMMAFTILQGIYLRLCDNMDLIGASQILRKGTLRRPVVSMRMSRSRNGIGVGGIHHAVTIMVTNVDTPALNRAVIGAFDDALTPFI